MPHHVRALPAVLVASAQLTMQHGMSSTLLFSHYRERKLHVVCDTVLQQHFAANSTAVACHVFARLLPSCRSTLLLHVLSDSRFGGSSSKYFRSVRLCCIVEVQVEGTTVLLLTAKRPGCMTWRFVGLHIALSLLP
jgi:hypothetical protein